jgi:hypothetical protein
MRLSTAILLVFLPAAATADCRTTGSQTWCEDRQTGQWVPQAGVIVTPAPEPLGYWAQPAAPWNAPRPTLAPYWAAPPPAAPVVIVVPTVAPARR